MHPCRTSALLAASLLLTPAIITPPVEAYPRVETHAHSWITTPPQPQPYAYRPGQQSVYPLSMSKPVSSQGATPPFRTFYRLKPFAAPIPSVLGVNVAPPPIQDDGAPVLKSNVTLTSLLCDPRVEKVPREDILNQVMQLNRTVNSLVKSERRAPLSPGDLSALSITEVRDVALAAPTVNTDMALEGISHPPAEIVQTANETTGKVRAELKVEMDGAKERLRGSISKLFEKEIASLPDLANSTSPQHRAVVNRIQTEGLENVLRAIQPSLTEGPGVVLERLQVALLSLVIDDLKSLFKEIVGMIHSGYHGSEWRHELKRRLKISLRKNFLAFIDSFKEALVVGVARFLVDALADVLKLGRAIVEGGILKWTENLLRRGIGPLLDRIQMHLRKRWNLPKTEVLDENGKANVEPAKASAIALTV